MFQDDQRAVIERCVVICEHMNRAVERCMDCRAGCCEKVHAQVNGAAFVQRLGLRTKQRRGVKQARFVVTAHADRSISLAKCLKDF